MHISRRQFVNITLGAGLLSACFGRPAWAGHEVDNMQGKVNGRYKASKIRVSEKDKEEVTLKKVLVELQERIIHIYLKDGTVDARIDQIYSMGFKLEVSAHDPVKSISYFVIIEGNFE